jgi:hypothetical protein
MDEMPKQYEWVKPGVRVDYHAVIGGPVTRAGYVVKATGQLPSGAWVAWLERKSGCVALEALSPPPEEPVFPEADYYACNDPETLTHETPEEALEDHLDGFLGPKMTVAEVVAAIRENSITVTAYRRGTVSEKLMEQWADNLLESLGETFSDEHGDPDAGPCDAFPDDAEKVMREAVKSIVSRSTVWRCEAIGEVDLTPDQIEKLMRAQRPDWFEEDAS